MLQRLVAIVLGVFGLASIGLGVASATVWRADDTLVATASTTSTSAGTLVVTAPGVLELGGAPVTATARADGGTKVVLAIGKEADVAGWVGTDPHAVISGLSDLSTLRTDVATPTPTPTPTPSETPAEAAAAPADPAAAPAAADPAAVAAPDPDGSDLWVAEAAGARSAELTWKPQPGRWTLLAAGAGEGAKAPVVVLSWPQTVTTPWLVPGVGVGAVLLALGIALGIRLWLRARRGEQAEWHTVETGAIPIVVRSGLTPTARGGSAGTGAGLGGAAPAGTGGLAVADDAPTVILTRRQMREAAATAPTPRVSLRRRAKGSHGSETGPETGGLPAVEVAATSPASLAHLTASPAADPAAPPARAASMAPGSLSAHEPPASDPADSDQLDAPASKRTRRSDRNRRLGSRDAAPASEPLPVVRSTTPGSSPAATDSVPATSGAAERWTPDRPTTPGVPSSPATPPSGSRADAWRRSWGIPDADLPGAPGATVTGPASPVPPAGAPGHHGPADPAAPRSGKDA